MTASRHEWSSIPANEQSFTTTHWSVVLSAKNDSSDSARDALEQLCKSYWYPLYAHVRRRGRSAEDAQDLTQEFFARLLEKHYLADVDRAKGRFRSFLLASLNHFLANEWDKARAAKRGGGQIAISLDEVSAENRFRLEPIVEDSPESIFDQQWALELLERALSCLRAEYVAAGKAAEFERLKRFLGHAPADGDYTEMAGELEMTAAAVAVSVHRMRHRYRDRIRAEVAQTVSDSGEVDGEMRHLFAALNG